MHDPMTVAFEIKYPWFDDKPWPSKLRKDPNPLALNRSWESMTEDQRKHRDRHWPEGYRKTFLTIWHVDPERDGSDDSCGYNYVKLTKKQREILRNAAWHEAENPHFLCCLEKEWNGTFSEAESLYRGLVLFVSRVLRLKMTFEAAAKYAAESTHRPDCIKFGSAFCFLPGYHTNSQEDSADVRQEHFHGVLCTTASYLLTEKRPWWKHPKYHFWHWHLQCHALINFKRWAFSRCCKCGKGFSWGYSPVTNNWNSTGPQWLRSEKDTFHSNCSHPKDECVSADEPSTSN